MVDKPITDVVATPEDEQAKQVELAQRKEEFVKDYGELVKKHKIDFAQYPVWVPDGNNGFKTVLQNTPVDVSTQLATLANQPTKSPFVAE